MINEGVSTSKSEAKQRSCSTSIMNIADKKLFEETSLAIQKSEKLLNIFDYIEAVNFKIDTFMLDKFWQCIAENSSAAISGTVLEWLGYDSKKEYDNKSHFIELLNAHNIQFKQIKHTDLEFSQYPELVEDTKLFTMAALKRKQWIIMDSRDFRKMVMCLRTKKADQIREYYICLEDLVKMYSEYTHHFQMIPYQRTITRSRRTRSQFSTISHF
jgi:hypothetical protein